MPDLPSGTVTFLFTDVEGSVRLWERAPQAMHQAMARHDAVVEACVTKHGGTLVRPRGEGDSRFAVFPRATDAVAAAGALQRAFLTEPWPTPDPVRVRIALHTGEGVVREGDYYGPAPNRCARVRNLAHGGQILLSEATVAVVQDALPEGVSLRSLGAHRLKGLQRPEEVFQLLHLTLPAEFPIPPSAAPSPAGRPRASPFLTVVLTIIVAGVGVYMATRAAPIQLAPTPPVVAPSPPTQPAPTPPEVASKPPTRPAPKPPASSPQQASSLPTRVRPAPRPTPTPAPAPSNPPNEPAPTQPAPPPTSTPAPSPSNPPSQPAPAQPAPPPTPTPAPSPTPVGIGDQQIIAGQGIGKLQLGMTIEEAVAAMGRTYDLRERPTSGRFEDYVWYLDGPNTAVGSPRLIVFVSEGSAKTYDVRVVASSRFSTPGGHGVFSTAATFVEEFGPPIRTRQAANEKVWTFRNGIYIFVGPDSEVVTRVGVANP